MDRKHLSDLSRAGRAGLREAGAFLVTHRAELLAAAALLGGWALLTWSAYAVLVVAAPRLAWPVWSASGGVLLLSVFGWRLLGTVAREGLYTLTRPAAKPAPAEERKRRG